MFTLTNLPKIVRGKNKRLGRGTSSGKGAKSGRGTTRHQKARQSIKLSFEGGQGKLSKKFPLLRGKGRNKSLAGITMVIKLEELNKLPDNSEVTLETLTKNGIIKDIGKYSSVKIVSTGELKKVLTIKLPVSKKTQEKVEKAGGTVQL